MKKSTVKKALSGLTVAGLLSSVLVLGVGCCHSKCCRGSCSGHKMEKGKTSCSGGSSSETDKMEMKKDKSSCTGGSK